MSASLHDDQPGQGRSDEIVPLPEWPVLRAWLDGKNPTGLTADLMEVEVASIIREVERLRVAVDRLVDGMRHPDRCPASYGPMHRCDCGVQKLIDEVSR